MSGLSRRRFLHTAGGGARVGGAAAVLPACAGGDKDSSVDLATAAVDTEHRYLDPYGDHQGGVVATHQAEGMLAAFTVHARDRAELQDTFESLTEEIRRLMSGTPYEERDPDYPPLYTGVVGNPPPPADLSVIVSVGASLFDDRFGLADRKPAELERMPFLANDRLDPERTHGDVLLSIASADQEVTLFALRQLMRATRGNLGLHWVLEGYNRRTETEPGEAGVRNLMGFVDGTANLDPTDEGLMDRLVWVADGDDEPAWAAGGTYQVVRVIRMFVEFWDRTRLGEQEALIGRKKATGAPLDGEVETDLPDFAADPDGDITPLDAHIRLANPRTPETEDQRILRKGFSFSRGFDGDGQLDQGLAFVSYQRSLQRQFLPVQARLDGEPLEEYLLPEGGGFFFALPGTPDDTTFLGQGLFA
jgi:deferrochelatase/peroxidase EfeB